MKKSNLFSLDGKNALITGSTQGLGRAMAEGLMAAGARVILNGRSEKKVVSLATEYRAQGWLAEAATFDVMNPDAIIKGIRTIGQQTGPIDILVNNAGGTIRNKFMEMSLEQWHKVMQLNLDSVFLVSKAVIPDMIKRKTGKVINVCSLMSSIARSENANYAASKGGVAMLTKELAVELGGQNIQVNGIAPGYFLTPLTQVLKDDEKFDSWYRRRTPMARWGKVSELAGAAVFLASEASSFITGQILYVDGGLTAAI